MDLRVGSKFRLMKRIGGGSFGDIYKGENVITKEEVAIKLESLQTSPPQLFTESKMYNMFSGATGFPTIKWFGQEGDYNVLVMDLLGKSLEDLFVLCQKRFTLKTVLMIGDQMIERIEYLHSKGVMHRDIKPDNFVMGTGNQYNIVFIIDYGLTKRFLDSRTHEHIQMKDGKKLTGTARYASLNTHKGFEQSRRDDLECIAYSLIYFLKGSLPWQGIVAENRRQKYAKIAEIKNSTPIPILCEGIPEEFAIFLDSIRKLEFEEKPDYWYYRKLFRELFIREGYSYDYQYDWLQSQQQILPMIKALDIFKKELVPERLNTSYVPKPSIRIPNQSPLKNVVPIITERNGPKSRVSRNIGWNQGGKPKPKVRSFLFRN